MRGDPLSPIGFSVAHITLSSRAFLMADASLSLFSTSSPTGANVPMNWPYSIALICALHMGHTPWCRWHSLAHSGHSALCSHGFKRVARGASMQTTQRPASASSSFRSASVASSAARLVFPSCACALLRRRHAFRSDGSMRSAMLRSATASRGDPLARCVAPRTRWPSRCPIAMHASASSMAPSHCLSLMRASHRSMTARLCSFQSSLASVQSRAVSSHPP
mmetsp:Transcript_4587/g.20861  ORF Transcript_4587/g.20861 Transcript_4587/m.20861 type:complete len:221 (+) Transcript_4587:411-1073(+)